MKKIIRYSIFLQLIFLWMIAVGAAQAYDLPNYLPVLEGNDLTYEQSIDGGASSSMTISVGNASLVNGTSTNPFITSINSGDIGRAQYVVWDTNGLQEHQSEARIRTSAHFQTFTGTFSSPLETYRLVLPKTLSLSGNVIYDNIVEDVVDWAGQADHKKAIASSVTLSAIQSVTVPAGTFDKCLKLTITETVDTTDPSGATPISSATFNTTLYLSYLVGVVQKTIDSTVVDAATSVITTMLIDEKLAEFIDSDGDYLTDDYEALIGTNPLSRDSDADGLKDGEEVIVYGFDPLHYEDTDGDGMSNDWENAYGLNPNNNNDAFDDLDGDGVNNVGELLYETNPTTGDTDGDGVDDVAEIFLADIGDPNADPTNEDMTPLQSALDPYNSLKNCSNLPVRIAGTTPIYYATLQKAYSAAANGDVIQTHAVSLFEDLTLDRDISVTLEGGFNCDYTNNPVNTALRAKIGATNIDLGTATIGNYVFQASGDDDADGIPNSWEYFFGVNPKVYDSNRDSDMDRLSNLDEYLTGTDPRSRKDTDGDRMTDDWETANNLDPNSNGDAGGDDDLDGLTNFEEFLAGTDPNSQDSDGDGVTDDVELALAEVGYGNADPLDPNVIPNILLLEVIDDLIVYDSLKNCTTFPVRRITGGGTVTVDYHSIQKAYNEAVDGDVIRIHAISFYENLNLNRNITVTLEGGYDCGFTMNPAMTTIKTVNDVVNIGDGTATLGNIIIVAVPDTDSDGMPDEWEFKYGLNPADATDALLDDDGDGLTNAEEFWSNTDPTNWDTDGDGFSDGYEVNHGLDALDVNSIPTVGDGDMNQDGVVDAGDVVLVQRIAFGLLTPTAPQEILGDVVPDSVIDGADVVVIQRMALGL